MTEQNERSADRMHERGGIEQPGGGVERETPNKTSGGPDPRGEHPVEPAEGARNPGSTGGTDPGEHPIEPAEGSRGAVNE